MSREFETMLIFYCEHCEIELRTQLHHAGKVARCTQCREKTKIPDLAVLLDDDFAQLPIVRKVS